MSKENNDNKTIIYGDINAPTQIGGNDNTIITGGNENEPKATYGITPIWRSPFTLGMLTWLSAIFGFSSLIPLRTVLKQVLNISTGEAELQIDTFVIQLIACAALFIIAIVFFSMRGIAKKQIMRPLMRGFAIDGRGQRIAFNRVHAGSCPKCGGEMIYYNKAIEWREMTFNDGRTKKEVTRRIPALECKRNPDHWFEVDIAEARVDE